MIALSVIGVNLSLLCSATTKVLWNLWRKPLCWGNKQHHLRMICTITTSDFAEWHIKYSYHKNENILAARANLIIINIINIFIYFLHNVEKAWPIMRKWEKTTATDVMSIVMSVQVLLLIAAISTRNLQSIRATDDLVSTYWKINFALKTNHLTAWASSGSYSYERSFR